MTEDNAPIANAPIILDFTSQNGFFIYAQAKRAIKYDSGDDIILTAYPRDTPQQQESFFGGIPKDNDFWKTPIDILSDKNNITEYSAGMLSSYRTIKMILPARIERSNPYFMNSAFGRLLLPFIRRNEAQQEIINAYTEKSNEVLRIMQSLMSGEMSNLNSSQFNQTLNRLAKSITDIQNASQNVKKLEDKKEL